jgi:hypothetical protein
MKRTLLDTNTYVEVRRASLVADTLIALTAHSLVCHVGATRSLDFTAIRKHLEVSLETV